MSTHTTGYALIVNYSTSVTNPEYNLTKGKERKITYDEYNKFIENYEFDKIVAVDTIRTGYDDLKFRFFLDFDYHYDNNETFDSTTFINLVKKHAVIIPSSEHISSNLGYVCLSENDLKTFIDEYGFKLIDWNELKFKYIVKSDSHNRTSTATVLRVLDPNVDKSDKPLSFHSITNTIITIDIYNEICDSVKGVDSVFKKLIESNCDETLKDFIITQADHNVYHKNSQLFRQSMSPKWLNSKLNKPEYYKAISNADLNIMVENMLISFDIARGLYHNVEDKQISRDVISIMDIYSEMLIDNYRLNIMINRYNIDMKTRSNSKKTTKTDEKRISDKLNERAKAIEEYKKAGLTEAQYMPLLEDITVSTESNVKNKSRAVKVDIDTNRGIIENMANGMSCEDISNDNLGESTRVSAFNILFVCDIDEDYNKVVRAIPLDKSLISFDIAGHMRSILSSMITDDDLFNELKLTKKYSDDEGLSDIRKSKFTRPADRVEYDISGLCSQYAYCVRYLNQYREDKKATDKILKAELKHRSKSEIKAKVDRILSDKQTKLDSDDSSEFVESDTVKAIKNYEIESDKFVNMLKAQLGALNRLITKYRRIKFAKEQLNNSNEVVESWKKMLIYNICIIGGKYHTKRLPKEKDDKETLSEISDRTIESLLGIKFTIIHNYALNYCAKYVDIEDYNRCKYDYSFIDTTKIKNNSKDILELIRKTFKEDNDYQFYMRFLKHKILQHKGLEHKPRVNIAFYGEPDSLKTESVNMLNSVLNIEQTNMVEYGGRFGGERFTCPDIVYIDEITKSSEDSKGDKINSFISNLKTRTCANVCKVESKGVEGKTARIYSNVVMSSNYPNFGGIITYQSEEVIAIMKRFKFINRTSLQVNDIDRFYKLKGEYNEYIQMYFIEQYIIDNFTCLTNEDQMITRQTNEFEQKTLSLTTISRFDESQFTCDEILKCVKDAMSTSKPGNKIQFNKTNFRKICDSKNIPVNKVNELVESITEYKNKKYILKISIQTLIDRLWDRNTADKYEVETLSTLLSKNVSSKDDLYESLLEEFEQYKTVESDGYEGYHDI